MTKDELITAYFEGSLSDANQQKFEQLLQTDAAFLEEFNFQKELQSALEKKNRKNTKAFLNTLEPASVENKPKVRSLTFIPWLAAASVVIAIGLSSWFLFFNNTDINTQELYAAYYEPYDNVVHPIERGNKLEDLKSRAFLAYEKEDYELAITLFEKLNQQSTDGYINFYNAIVLMQLERHKEAIPLFKNYISSKGELSDRAHWYLALSYLKTNTIGNAKNELDSLIKLKGFKQEDAKALRDQLN